MRKVKRTKSEENVKKTKIEVRESRLQRGTGDPELPTVKLQGTKRAKV